MRISQTACGPACAYLAAALLLAACSTTDPPEDPQPAAAKSASLTGADSAAAPTVQEAEEVALQEPVPKAEATVEEQSGAFRLSPALRRLVNMLELGSSYSAEAGQWTFKGAERSLVLRKDSRVAKLDGVTVMLDAPFERSWGLWSLGRSDRETVFETAFRKEPRSSYIRSIVIDPGHGGSEPGARNDKLDLLEKDLNLDVALRLQKELEDLDYQVALTRYDDRFVPLADRPLSANSAQADLFVSLHFNAAVNSESKGLETYMLTPSGEKSTSSSSPSPSDELSLPGNRFYRESFELAFGIQQAMVDQLRRGDRGVKKARFAVLKSLDCPGVLVEGGFISNDGEAQLIATAGYRERLAQAIASAIHRYASEGEDKD